MAFFKMADLSLIDNFQYVNSACQSPLNIDRFATWRLLRQHQKKKDSSNVVAMITSLPAIDSKNFSLQRNE
jgi:hypothetical protein